VEHGQHAAGSPGGAYPPSTNPAQWTTFNYRHPAQHDRRRLRAVDEDAWFVRVDYNEVDTSGLKLNSGQLGTGSSNGLIQFGAPVDYKTKNAFIEGGYSTKHGA